MPKTNTFEEVKEALRLALHEEITTPVVIDLKDMTNATQIFNESKKQLATVHQLSNSITLNARYHQGRAVELPEPKIVVMKKNIWAITRNVYNLFKGHEELIPYYKGPITQLAKLTGENVKDLRTFMDQVKFDKINLHLDELLDSKFEDELFPTDEGDVTVSPKMIKKEQFPELATLEFN